MSIYILIVASCLGFGDTHECSAPSVRWFYSSDSAAKAYLEGRQGDSKHLYRISLFQSATPEVTELGVFASRKQEVLSENKVNPSDEAQ